MLSGTAAQLSENGEAGLLVNIADYLDQMPNFKAYLDENPIVKLSITGNTDTGAIYFSPYFDGVNDIERMPLMRMDWVRSCWTAKASSPLKPARIPRLRCISPICPPKARSKLKPPPRRAPRWKP